MTSEQILEKWRRRQKEFEELGVQVRGAAVATEVLADLESLLGEREGQLLTLQEAAEESGYSTDHLRRLIRAGHLRDFGRRYAPRLRRADLPRKAGHLPSALVVPIHAFNKAQIARAVVNSE